MDWFFLIWTREDWDQLEGIEDIVTYEDQIYIEETVKRLRTKSVSEAEKAIYEVEN
jgi:hypothetical protein